MKKNEESLKDLWDTIKWIHGYILGVPEGDEKEKGAETLFEGIMAKNLPNLRKMDIQIQEAQFTPTSIRP